MEFPSPVFSPRYRNYPQQSTYQSPFNSPGGGRISSENSPDFIPFSYSSPLKKGRKRESGHRRYFSASNGSFSSSGSSYSPYNNRQNRSRGSFGKNSFWDSNGSNISLYVDPSVLEDPWAELESELKNKKCQTDANDGNKVEIENQNE